VDRTEADEGDNGPQQGRNGDERVMMWGVEKMDGVVVLDGIAFAFAFALALATVDREVGWLVGQMRSTTRCHALKPSISVMIINQFHHFAWRLGMSSNQAVSEY
jgi:hypothetical protein